MVVEYRFRTELDGDDKIEQIIGTFIVRALGAGTKNGFGFALTDLDKSKFIVSGALITPTTSGGYVSTDTDGWEDQPDNLPVVIVADDLTKVMPLWANTSIYGIRANPQLITIKITPKVGEDILYDDFAITYENFNPFMIIDFENEGRVREVHKVDYAPTALADLSFFGTSDDNSANVLGTQRTYRSILNFPWVLDIPSNVTSPTVDNSAFNWAQEKKDINWAYLHFADWVENGTYDLEDTLHDPWWLGIGSRYRYLPNIYLP